MKLGRHQMLHFEGKQRAATLISAKRNRRLDRQYTVLATGYCRTEPNSRTNSDRVDIMLKVGK